MNPLYKAFLITAGTVNVGLGILGIFLPLMPSTVFFLIAAGCYVRSSPALYQRLITHPRIGPLIYNYRTHRAMPRKAKRNALGMLWITLSVSAVMVRKPLAWAILGLVFVGVSTLIWRTRTLEDVTGNSPETTPDS